MGRPEDPFGPTVRQPRYFWQPIVFSAVFFALALGAVIYFLSIAADRENEQARNSTNHLARTAIDTLRRDLTGRLVDYAWWNDMASQVARGIDPAWADSNIGSYLQEEFDYSGTFLLGTNNETLYASAVDPALPADGMRFLGSDAAAFMAPLRAVPAMRSEVASTFVRWQDKVYMVAAGSVTFEEPTPDQQMQENRPVLVFFRLLDGEVLSDLGGRFLFHNFRLAEGEPTDVGKALVGLNGKTIMQVTWDQERPGDTLLAELGVKIGLVTLILAVAAVALSYVWARTAITANVAKSRFLAKMSHELLTPLNPIIGFAQIMSSEMFGPLSTRYREYADDILRSGRHLQAVVRDVLDFSRIETGELGLEESTIELAKLIQDLPPITISRPDPAGGSNDLHALPLRTEIDERLPLFVGDERRIRQVLINVLFNAAKFSDGQEVTLRAGISDGGAIRVEIEDQGIGIAAQDIPKAFEPFVQLNPTGGRTRNRVGTGIGLSISRELMHMHGGTLDMESELGKGTRVIMTFPADRVRSAVSATARAIEESRAGGRSE